MNDGGNAPVIAAPKSAIDGARDIWALAQAFIEDTPVVEDEATALKANEMLSIVKGSFDAVEKARDEVAKPLYTAWMDARNGFAPALSNLNILKTTIGNRLTVFMKAEEARRAREAEALRQEALKKEEAAREAERIEREAVEDANLGEVGVNVAGATAQADAAFQDFEKTAREAALAEKNETVRMRSRFAPRATSLRNVEVLSVTNINNAISALWPNDKILEAVLSAAREYRKQSGKLPDGVDAEVERRL